MEKSDGSRSNAMPTSAHGESSQDDPQRAPEAGGQNASDDPARPAGNGDANEKADAKARIADPSGEVIDERQDAE
ncbi:MAG: hypothetical protein ABR505_12270 [Actinomycetota bacterium]